MYMCVFGKMLENIFQEYFKMHDGDILPCTIMFTASQVGVHTLAHNNLKERIPKKSTCVSFLTKEKRRKTHTHNKKI